MTTNKQRHNLSVNREILSLSLPSIVTNITTPLLGLVDVAIVGHMDSASYIGAIAIGGSMFNMLYWLFGFLRMGSSGMTAQAFGAKDRLAQSRILQQALLVAMLAGIAMIVLRHQVCEAVLWFMDVEADTAVLARTYFEILVWGAPAVLGTYVMSGWFLGMQNSRAPMWVSIFINLCNIAVSLVLVYCFNYDIPGVAVGSLVAQWGGFMLACSICLIRYDIVLSTFKEIVEIKGLKHFFRINVDIFLRTLCLVAVTLWFTRTGSPKAPKCLPSMRCSCSFSPSSPSSWTDSHLPAKPSAANTSEQASAPYCAEASMRCADGEPDSPWPSPSSTPWAVTCFSIS